MAVDVKKGGRQEYICAGCGLPIAKGEPHKRTGAGTFKRYHPDCLPDPKAKTESKAEKPVTDKKPHTRKKAAEQPVIEETGTTDTTE